MEQKTEASQAVEELLADFKKALQLADKVGRSRQDNGYAQNSTAVDALVTLQMSIEDRIRAALKAQPAPTEAARDRIPMPTNADQAELMQKLGLAWLQTNAPDRLTDAGRAAQGEDSARLECAHANGRTASWDWITCDDCGAIYTGSGEREWGVAQNMWFKSVSEAKFYKENGRYPDRARASAETDGVKP